MNILSQYVKTLFPWRWLYPFTFMMITFTIVYLGVESEDQLNRIYFNYPTLFYIGNVLYWLAVDYIFGLGQKNVWERTKETED